MTMDNLEAVSAQLGKIAAAFKDGGLFFLIGVGLFLAYLVIMAAIKHRRRATQEVNVNLPGPLPQNGNGTPKVCPAHSGFDARISAVEEATKTARADNSTQHKQLFDGMNSISINLAGLTAAIKK